MTGRESYLWSNCLGKPIVEGEEYAIDSRMATTAADDIRGDHDDHPQLISNKL